MPVSVFGLPVHPLVVHATVVAVPTAALFVVLAAVWGAFRRWAGPLPLLLCLASLVLDPISTASGENLERQLPHSDLIEQHSRLADGLLPFLAVLTVAAAAVTWVWYSERTSQKVQGPAVLIGISLFAVLAGLGTAQQVVRIGHSGAKAAWSDVSQDVNQTQDQASSGDAPTP